MDLHGRQRVPLRFGQGTFDVKRSDGSVSKRFQWHPDVIYCRRLFQYAGYQVSKENVLVEQDGFQRKAL